MSRDDLAQVEGSVTNILSGGIYEIKLNSGQTITAKLCGKMRKFRIRVIIGDKVTVGLSPYDLSHGLIIARQKVQGPGGPPSDAPQF